LRRSIKLKHLGLNFLGSVKKNLKMYINKKFEDRDYIFCLVSIALYNLPNNDSSDFELYKQAKKIAEQLFNDYRKDKINTIGFDDSDTILIYTKNYKK